MASGVATTLGPRESTPGHIGPFSVAFRADAGRIAREAFAGAERGISFMPHPAPGRNLDSAELAGLWNAQELAGVRPHTPRRPNRRTIRVVDLFCGCGGLSLGLRRAADAVGARAVFALAVDVSRAAVEVYARNFRPFRTERRNVATLIEQTSAPYDADVGGTHSVHLDGSLDSLRGTVDILLAGPPCEGNSNLNNRTRRSDPRNDLYLDVVLGAISMAIPVIVVENVPSVVSARQNVVGRARSALRAAGYRVSSDDLILTASDFGTPQDRRRHFLVAARSAQPPRPDAFGSLRVAAPGAGDAIERLRNVARDTTFDTPSRLSDENQRRVEFLVSNGQHELPDHERPDCHRLKPHSYPAIYGRMHSDRPAPTLTTGFLSPGRGRFVHPTEARSLTPHEGARLQGFGDDFDWLRGASWLTRADYANMIGAAVPPQLGFAVGMSAVSLL